VFRLPVTLGLDRSHLPPHHFMQFLNERNFRKFLIFKNKKILYYRAPAFGIQQQRTAMQQIGKATIDLSPRNASLRTLDHCASEEDYRFTV
jgi:hypothetical protein